MTRRPALVTRALDVLTDVQGLVREIGEWGDGRRDPAHRRLAAADALNDVDRALTELRAIRAELTEQIGRWDDGAA